MTHSTTWRQRRATMMVADGAAILAVYILCDYFRCRFHMHCAWPELIDNKYSSVRVQMKVLAFLPFAWPAILHQLGWYEQRWRSWHWVLRRSAVAAILLGLFMAAAALLLERDLYPRFQIALTVGAAPATAWAVRGMSSGVGRWFGARQRRRVLIVGTQRQAVRLRRLLRSAALDRPEIVGHLRGSWETDPGCVPPAMVLGGPDQLAQVLDAHIVDEVVFSAPLEELPRLLPLVALCEEIGVTAQIQAESMMCHAVPEIVNFSGVPLLSYSPVRHPPELLSVKRAIDIVVSIIGIILTAPIMFACALLIKLSSPGPILFRQRRSGLNGREFGMLKFRTMTPDAEQRLAEIAHLNESDGPVFKATNDPRRTRVGAWLRRWSLDELPQLFNVLVGDMSIVGPRPPIPAEVIQYDRWQRRRLSMRPGLTCLWQIKGRHRVGFEEWMRLDLFYIDYWSLRLDFLIMWKTIAAVLSGTGA